MFNLLWISYQCEASVEYAERTSTDSSDYKRYLKARGSWMRVFNTTVEVLVHVELELEPRSSLVGQCSAVDDVLLVENRGISGRNI